MIMQHGAAVRRNAGAGAPQIYGGVAQLGERTVRIRKVESSILFVSTMKSPVICNGYRAFYYAL